MLARGQGISRLLLANLKSSEAAVVVENQREALKEAYTKTLRDLESLPDHFPYRIAMETFVRPKLKILEEGSDWNVIKAGPMDESLREAHWHHHLIQSLAEAKPWDHPESYNKILWRCDLLPGPQPPIPTPVNWFKRKDVGIHFSGSVSI